MNVWVYEDSFEGLMTVVYTWFYTKEKPFKILAEQHFQQDLLSDVKYIMTDQHQAQKVAEGIVNKLGKDTFELLIKAYLSEDAHIAEIIIQFLEYAFKKGAAVVNHLSDPRVAAFIGRSTAVSRESHKLIGMVRFVELSNGILYGAYDSTYNQVLILAPHFAQRLGNQVWVIHDTKRGIGAFYQKGDWHMGEMPENIGVQLSKDETLFQNLWKRYYKHIAIEERKNHNLRRQNMPKKYWHFLTELQ